MMSAIHQTLSSASSAKFRWLLRLLLGLGDTARLRNFDLEAGQGGSVRRRFCRWEGLIEAGAAGDHDLPGKSVCSLGGSRVCGVERSEPQCRRQRADMLERLEIPGPDIGCCLPWPWPVHEVVAVGLFCRDGICDIGKSGGRVGKNSQLLSNLALHYVAGVRERQELRLRSTQLAKRCLDSLRVEVPQRASRVVIRGDGAFGKVAATFHQPSAQATLSTAQLRHGSEHRV